MMGFGMMGGGGFSLIIWVIIIVGIIYFLNNRNGNDNYHQSDKYRKGNRAVEIAKERYARGELSRKDFEELLKDLS